MLQIHDITDSRHHADVTFDVGNIAKSSPALNTEVVDPLFHDIVVLHSNHILNSNTLAPMTCKVPECLLLLPSIS